MLLLPPRALGRASARFSILTLLLVAFAAVPTWAQTIEGTVYRDYNADAQRGTYEPGVSGVLVKAYAAGSTTPDANATTAADGSYTLSGLTGGANYRVELTGLPDFLQDGASTNGDRTTVRFAQSGATGINFGVNNPAQYCDDNPELATPCYVNGDPLAGGDVGTAEWLVQHPWNPSSVRGENAYLANGTVIGSTWGLAHQRSSNSLFAAAMMKRHSGFGVGGPGAIYKIDLDGPVDSNGHPPASLFLDLNTDYGVSAGTDPRDNTTANGLSSTKTTPNHDSLAFDLVGKMSLGDIDISEDESRLYVINLHDQKLYEIEIGTTPTKPASITAHTIPAPVCDAGVFRPWAVKAHDGLIYVGGVCTSENGGTRQALQAYVYSHNPAGPVSNFTVAFNFGLDYERGNVSKDGNKIAEADWKPWISQWSEIVPVPKSSQAPFRQAIYAQPILSDIEFDTDGSMLLGFIDRFGHQVGNFNYQPSTSDTRTFEGANGGDLIRVCRDAGGGFTLENNATCGTNQTSGAGTGQGPGGGEFYHDDNFGGTHDEIVLGGAAHLFGSNLLATTAFDPVNRVRAAGTIWHKNTDGGRGRSYEVFGTDAGGRPATFGKASGLGDIELLCDGAPLEIGNRLWMDSGSGVAAADRNGIQDPGENGIQGVEVTLTCGGQTATTTTDASGLYFFKDGEGDIASWTGGIIPRGAQCILSVDEADAALGGKVATKANQGGSDDGADLRDSDLEDIGGGIAAVTFTTGQSGDNTFAFDGGFAAPLANLGDLVFFDDNRNGIQDNGETGVQGVTASLYTCVGGVRDAFVTSLVTDANGNYLFEDLAAGDYLVEFDANTLPSGFVFSPQNQGGDDAIDSDADPISGQSDCVTLASGETNRTVDAGINQPVASLGNFVFDDTDRDGIQDGGEAGVPGVTVKLYRCVNGVRDAFVSSATTDANGAYGFADLEPGEYAVEFELASLPSGFIFSPQDQGGNNAVDSDAAANGFTSCITLAPGENNDTIDAGINAPPIAKLGDFVFEDANRNGIQDNGEAGVQGVTVQLYRCVNGVRDAFVTEVTTDANGEYLFDNLQPGEYQVEFVASSLPSGFVFSPQDQGGDDAADSDADPTSGVTDCLTLQAGDDIRTVDAGINQPAKASLGDRVFFDTDGDGVQDPGENGVPNITVELFTCVGGTPDTKVSDTTTDANGMYLFADLDAGDYAVRFVESTLPNGAKFTQRDQGGDEALDSDADPATGFTACVTLNNGDVNRDLDAGVVEGIDLELAKIVDQPAPSLNDNVVFTITVLNNSNPDATGVIVTDDFPAGLTPISTDAGAAATINGQVVTWDIGTVDGQASVSINITASVDAEATLRNCAEVTAANEDDVDSTPNDGQGDDFACATVTSDGSSGGGGGGVESDGNMASKLANRLFERRQNAMFATGNRRVASPVIMAANDFAPRISSNVNGVNIATFFPEDGPQESQPFVVTPDDLLGITNATSVFATDYLRVDGRRLGAVIGLTSPSGSIYDHAKTTCDRLGGGRLDDVQRIAVGDQTYILSTLFHPTGHVDYAISFVAYRTGTSYVIDSQFAPDIYEVPAGVDEVLNFQVWTVAPRYSAHLVEEIIAKLDAEGDVSFLNETTAPSVPPVYIESGAYRNGVLTLNVVNTTGAAYTTTLRGSTTDTETEASNQLRMPFERTLSVPAPVAPARSVQIQVETGSIFDAELALADGDVALDRVYWADGPWGTSEGAATITEFTTFAQDEAPVEAGTFRIERDAYITGTVTDHAALFRYIRPNAQPVDLSSFDALTFTAYGQGRLRVVLEQAANTDGDHYAFDVRLTNTPRTFTIAYDDFYQSLGTTGFNGEGITTMVFYMIGDGQISQPFDLVLEGVAFVGGSSSVAVEDPTETPDGFALAQNYPNPFNPSTTIGFMVPQAAPVSLVVYDLLGRPVQTLVDGTVAAGAHEVVFEAGNLPSGTYVYRLQAGGQTFTRTLVLMK